VEPKSQAKKERGEHFVVRGPGEKNKNLDKEKFSGEKKTENYQND